MSNTHIFLSVSIASTICCLYILDLQMTMICKLMVEYIFPSCLMIYWFIKIELNKSYVLSSCVTNMKFTMYRSEVWSYIDIYIYIFVITFLLWDWLNTCVSMVTLQALRRSCSRSVLEDWYLHCLVDNHWLFSSLQLHWLCIQKVS